MTTEQGAYAFTGTNALLSPGEVLEEELQTRGMTQKELAEKMGRPAQTINEIVRGKKELTAETALQLENVLGISAAFWVRMEAQYRLSLARRKVAKPA